MILFARRTGDCGCGLLHDEIDRLGAFMGSRSELRPTGARFAGGHRPAFLLPQEKVPETSTQIAIYSLPAVDQVDTMPDMKDFIHQPFHMLLLPGFPLLESLLEQRNDLVPHS